MTLLTRPTCVRCNSAFLYLDQEADICCATCGHIHVRLAPLEKPRNSQGPKLIGGGQ